MDVPLLQVEGEQLTSMPQLLREAGCRVLAWLRDPTALEGALAHHRADLIVMELPEPDLDLLQRVGELGRLRRLPVAVFVERTDPDSIRTAIRAGVSSYVVHGAHLDWVRSELEVARMRFTEERALREQLDTARRELGDRKIIERAKGILMQREGLDEQSAYDTLRRAAMRRNCRIVEVAYGVLVGGSPLSS